MQFNIFSKPFELGALSTFPHGTCALSVGLGILICEGGPPIFRLFKQNNRT